MAARRHLQQPGDEHGPEQQPNLHLARHDHRHGAGGFAADRGQWHYQRSECGHLPINGRVPAIAAPPGRTSPAPPAATYTPVEADETLLLRVVETATDSGTSQSGTSTSAATAAVADIVLAFTSAAAISGTAAVGSALTAVNGALNDADASVTGYQWQSSSDSGSTWSNIAGATGSTYTPVTADQGKVLRVVETATDADGGPSTTSNSPATAAVPTTSSLFSAIAVPGTITENDPNSVELGVKFQASTNGTIIGIRFYKGPQNTGTHMAICG